MRLDANKKIEAAEALKITAPDMLALGLVDAIVPEPSGGAHNNPDAVELDCVERVFVGEVAPNARLPDLPGPGDLLARVIVVCSVETFHRRPHGRVRRSVLLASGLGIPPMTLDPKGFASSASPSQGSPVMASARHFVLRDRELVTLARLDHEFAPVVLAYLAGDGAAEIPVAQSPSRMIWLIRSTASRSCAITRAAAW